MIDITIIKDYYFTKYLIVAIVIYGLFLIVRKLMRGN